MMKQQSGPKCSAMIATYHPAGMEQCARRASQEVAGLFPACTRHARAVAADFDDEVDELADMVLNMKIQSKEASELIEDLRGELAEWKRVARAKHGSLADDTVMPVKLRPSVVYYIACGRYIKIGKAVDVESRLRQLQMGGVLAPHDIRFHEARLIATEPGGLAEESMRHVQFADTRVEGEWFTSSPGLTAHIESLIAVPHGNTSGDIAGYSGHPASGSERVE